MGDKGIWKILVILMVLVTIVSCAAMPSAGDVSESEVKSSSATIYVPDDYAKIQAAVDVASAGDTIIVRDGTYTENVDVNKRLTIRSENGSDKTIVRAKNSENCVFTVSAHYVNVSGFMVEGGIGRGFVKIIVISKDGFHRWGLEVGGWCSAGIHLYKADYCNISNNIASNNGDGIRLSGSSYNTIMNNIANANNMDGISLDSSSSNFLMNNNASSNNADGIYIREKYSKLICGPSNYNTLTNNTASNNRYFGFDLFSCLRSTLTGNTANSNGYDGISLAFSSKNILANNTANLNNGNGIDLYLSSNYSTLTGNSACSNNNTGIFLYYSSNNEIYLNNFINNTYNVYSYNSTNIWNSTEKITYTYKGKIYKNDLGNYWDNYKEKYPDAEEIDETGICDSPYSINSDNDYYPLIEPYENYHISMFSGGNAK